MRLVQLVILITLGVMLYRYVRRKLPSSSSAGRKGGKVENLVQCAVCGVRLPESEAHCKQGVCYCPSHSRR